MPLRVTADETARAGPATRKRTFEQITRSQSRSITPTAPPPKRRRANTTAPRITRSNSQMSSREPTPAQAQRFAGDGLDYRRPAPSAIEAAQAHTTIDLTQDDDEEEQIRDEEFQRIFLSPSLAPTDLSIDLEPLEANGEGRTQSREPRNGSQRPPWRRIRATTEVIDITGDENEEGDDHSSDIEILGSRRLPQPAGHFNRRLPNPLPNLRRANAQSWGMDSLGPLGTFIQGIRGHGQNGFAVSGLLDHVNRMMAGPLPVAIPGPEPLDLATYDNIDGLDDYDDIQMEYGIPPEFMEDPGVNDIVTDAYKPPAAARKGFTRDIEEDGDVLVCVGCDEELAAGDEDDLKAQVWVSKKCGHVYCGECHNRKVSYRSGNDRNRAQSKKRKLDELKECKVEGCSTKLTGKTAMFQIYL